MVSSSSSVISLPGVGHHGLTERNLPAPSSIQKSPRHLRNPGFLPRPCPCPENRTKGVVGTGDLGPVAVALGWWLCLDRLRWWIAAESTIMIEKLFANVFGLNQEIPFSIITSN